MKRIVLFILSAALTFAADITGKWAFNVELDAGSGVANFELKQTGNKVTGKYHGVVGDADVTGTINGDKVELTFSSDQAGTVKYSGTVEGDNKMSGTCEYGQLGGGKFTATKQ
jgi:hypothetical protein